MSVRDHRFAESMPTRCRRSLFFRLPAETASWPDPKESPMSSFTTRLWARRRRRAAAGVARGAAARRPEGEPEVRRNSPMKPCARSQATACEGKLSIDGSGGGPTCRSRGYAAMPESSRLGRPRVAKWSSKLGQAESVEIKRSSLQNRSQRAASASGAAARRPGHQLEGHPAFVGRSHRQRVGLPLLSASALMSCSDQAVQPVVGFQCVATGGRTRREPPRRRLRG